MIIDEALIESSEPPTSGCCLEVESQGACVADLSHHSSSAATQLHTSLTRRCKQLQNWTFKYHTDHF